MPHQGSLPGRVHKTGEESFDDSDRGYRRYHPATAHLHGFRLVL